MCGKTTNYKRIQMRPYSGRMRRQAGGLWSTMIRRVRPIVSSVFRKLKPHAFKLGKKLAKKAVGSALNVGTQLAGDVVSGKYKNIPDQMKQSIRGEAQQWQTDATNEVSRLKQKYLDDDDDDIEQAGRGYKRKRISPHKKRGKRKISKNNIQEILKSKPRN